MAGLGGVDNSNKVWNGSNITTMDRGLNIPAVSVTMMDNDDDGLGLDLLDDNGLGLDLLDDLDLGSTDKKESEKTITNTP